MIYLDNAATTWPKPPEVFKAMADLMEKAGGNPGRSGHRLSVAAAQIIHETRELTARLFNCPDPGHVVFTSGATHALNQALYGLLKPGDHVVTGSMEHNAVMRPLRDLENRGVKVTVVVCNDDCTANPGAFEKAVTPGTRLVCVLHASNVTGTIVPTAELARIAHSAGALLLVDGAQSAGVLPIDLQAEGVDLFGFTGHKGTLGPMGTGALIFGDRVDPKAVSPLILGGTGSLGEREEQPDFLPDRFESGTPNAVGIAGLGAGIMFVMHKGVARIWEHEKRLAGVLREGLAAIGGIRVYGPPAPDKSTGIVSFTLIGKRPSEIGRRLDEEYGILVRTGLQDAPAAHRSIGTYPEGTVRLAPGFFTTMEEIQATLKAIQVLARE